MYWIWLIYDEWLCRYEWWSEIPKWRLDDVMVGWSGWKGYCIHSSSGQRYCENLKMIAHSVFWDIFNTKFIQREVQKRFVQTSLRAMYRRWRHPIGRNLVSEYFEMTFWIENLTMLPTSDWKSETTLPIAHSLSYNILKFWRILIDYQPSYWAKNNVMQIHVLEKSHLP